MKKVTLNAMFNRIFIFIFFLPAVCVTAQKNDWKFVGPGEIKDQVKGMVTALWADPSDLNHMMAGSATGGLFETQNAMSATPEWTCISDTYRAFMTCGVKGIAVKPGADGKEIYVATGQDNHLQRGYGIGILKTTNGGKSWERVGPGNPANHHFLLYGLVMNEDNADEMIAFTAKAVYLTRDSWKSWDSVAVPIDQIDYLTHICDVEFAPYEPGKFYVCSRTKNKDEAKLLVFSDYGKAVQDITPKDMPSARMEVATVRKPSQKGKLYLAGGATGIFVKYYDGKSFSPVLNPSPVLQLFAEAYWNLEFAVSAVDTTHMYMALTECSQSTNGGKVFDKISYYNGVNAHADNRCMLLVKDKSGGDALILGNDGGVSFTNGFAYDKWKNLNGRGLDITQFWGVSVSESDTLLVAGGTADNGGFMMSENKIVNTMMGCGDGYLATVIGAQSAIIECNPPTVIYHNNKSGTAYHLIIQDNRCGPKRPMVKRDSAVYLGYHDLWRISERLLNAGSNRPEKITDFPLQKNAIGQIRNDAISAFGVSKYGSALVAYGSPNWQDPENTGKVFFTPDINKNDWKDITALVKWGTVEICRWLHITSVCPDPLLDNRFYIVATNVFNQADNGIYRLDINDAADSLKIKKVSYGIPAVGINDFQADEYSNVFYMASDHGIYFADALKDSLQWLYMNDRSLPPVMVFGLHINYNSNSLFAATFGRGIWKCRLERGAGNNHVRIGGDYTISRPYKVDGTLVVAGRKTLTVKSKLIITNGSKIVLQKGSSLILNGKSLLRDEDNKLTDAEKVITKKKKAKVIIKE